MGGGNDREGVRDRHGLAALLLYLALSIFFFGRALFGHFSTICIGNGDPDPSLYMWCMEWWPHAFAHSLNLFVTHAIWAPHGFNLAWTTSIPLVSWLAFPLTRTFGLVPTFNMLSILFPALAAWTAFILCRHVARQYWPALIGGYVFGFSSYMLAQVRSHFFCEIVFLIPLIVYLVVRKVEGTIRTPIFVVLLTLALAAQFLFSMEIFATMTTFGAIAMFLAVSFNSGEIKKRLYAVSIPIAGSYALAAGILSPYLYYLFAFGHPHGAFFPPRQYSADLLNFVIPSSNNQIGSIHALTEISRRFPGGNVGEVGAYLSLPLIVIAIAFARRNWREPPGKLMIDSLIIICLLSLGPVLHTAGILSVGLPEKLIAELPLLDKALPVRFIVYGLLDLALISSLWFAAVPAGSHVRHAAAIAVILFLLPNLSASFWVRLVDNPAFFSSPLYKRYLSKGETVLILPYCYRADSMLWQAETHMYFNMAGGWTFPTPPEFMRWPIVSAFYHAAEVPHPTLQFKAFLANHNVTAIIVADREQLLWQPLLATLDVKPLSLGGVTLYKIPPDRLEPYRKLDGFAMEKQANSIRFAALIVAANKYLAEGGSSETLAPFRLHQLKLLPPDWLIGPSRAPRWITNATTSFVDPNARFSNDLWAGSWEHDKIVLGTLGSYGVLQPLMASYRPSASRVLFVSKDPNHAPGARDWGLMLAVFDRAQLAAAASRVAKTGLNPYAGSSSENFGLPTARAPDTIPDPTNR
jgi:hypothetical protein